MMEQGIYNISNHDYHRNPKYAALNRSLLTELIKSPLHYLNRTLTPPEPPTRPMEIGSLTHWLVLEVEKFDARAAIWHGSKVSKKYKAWAKKLKDDMIVVSPDEYDHLMGMHDSVYADETASALLKKGHTEESFFWHDAAHPEILCKCKTDYRIPSLKLIIDLKTTKDASPDGFAKSCANFSYDIQAAWTLNGVRAVTGDFYRDFIFVAVEKTPPYAVGVYRASQEMLDAGRNKIRPLLDTLADCEAKDSWPGYTTGIADLDLPRWAA